jgi:hypothetical protein
MQIQQEVSPPMIIYLAQGEPSYLPDGLFVPLRDEADPDLARFLQRYAHRPLVWTVAAFMAENAGWYSHADICAQLALSASSAIAHLGALVENGFVEERMLITGPSYRFSASYRTRAFFKLWAPTLQCEQ